MQEFVHLLKGKWWCCKSKGEKQNSDSTLQT